MTDTPPLTGTVSATPNQIAEEKPDHQKRVTAVAWLVGISAVAAFSCTDSNMSVGAGMAFVAIAAMVTIVACAILRIK